MDRPMAWTSSDIAQYPFASARVNCTGRLSWARWALILVAGVHVTATAVAAESLVKDGEAIAFLGDSITQYGAESNVGYVRLVMRGLEANGIKARAIPAGIAGHKSNQMLARLDRDVLDKKPTWMTLSCGVNDVGHGVNGVPLAAYKQNITTIVEKCQAAGIKVMILTATVIYETGLQAGANKTLIDYNEFLRGLAKEKHCPLADLNADMQATIKNAPVHKSNLLTIDGIHMNPAGNMVMAIGVLKGFGLDEAQIQKAQVAWLEIPDACCEVTGSVNLTIRQWRQFEAEATQKKLTVPELIDAKGAAMFPAPVGQETK